MADFQQNINDFISRGTYNYQFDSAGNEILNPSSSIFQQTYFAFPLTDVNYNDSKIESFYNPEFTEFVKPVVEGTASVEIPEDLMEQLATVRSENEQLTQRLNELIILNEQVSTPAEEQLIKDVIMGLRIQMGQGQSPGDFETEFPYLPLPLEDQPSRLV